MSHATWTIAQANGRNRRRIAQVDSIRAIYDNLLLTDHLRLPARPSRNPATDDLDDQTQSTVSSPPTPRAAQPRNLIGVLRRRARFNRASVDDAAGVDRAAGAPSIDVMTAW